MDIQTIIIIAYAFPVVLIWFIWIELEWIKKQLVKLNNK